MTDLSVSVVIVNWNGGTYLLDCLHKLKAQTLAPSRILVMDNGSTDGSCEAAERVPGVTVKRLSANLGFAAANNRAIEECDTDLVALLNPDAFPEPDWLEQLVDAAKTRPDVASFGSRQMLHGFENILDGTGDIYHISGVAWRDRHGFTVQPDVDLIPKEIFCPCAAAALYRRDVWLASGGFDEDFFCYVEDVDLGFRLRILGYQSLYVPSAVVNHVGAATSGGHHSEFAVYHGHRNLVWAFIKNMPGLLFWLLLPVHLTLNMITLAHFALRGHGGVMLKAKVDALKNVPAFWLKRRQIQARRRASIQDIWRMLDKRLSTSRSVTYSRPEP